jgi:hypothetical protein
MNSPLGYREVLALTLETLRDHPQGQWEVLTLAVVDAAKRKQLLPREPANSGIQVGGRPLAEAQVGELVRQAMWDCLLNRLLIFGMNRANSEWPFYRVTEHGMTALKAATPQPYDPDGFMTYFDATCTGMDPVVRSYVEEAVHAFNSNCARSSAVMLGCASEKLLLLLCEALEASISDPTKQAKFARNLNARWQIAHKYEALRSQLEELATAKKLSRDHVETIRGELPANFELLRRCRNTAGHPDVPGNVTPDTVFMNLRTFTEYARRAHELIEHFRAVSIDW